MKLRNIKNDRGGASTRLLVCVAVASVLPILLFAAGPQWWTDLGVTATDTNGNPLPANDYAAVNQGQLKNIATAGINHCNTYLPTTVTGTLNALALQLSATSANTNDYAPVNIGQAKNVAKPFYDALAAVGYQGLPLQTGEIYPWSNSTKPRNDYAMANIGQVKNLFSFDLTYSFLRGL